MLPHRRSPILEISGEQLHALVAPLLGERVIAAVEPAEGGLINTVLRILPAGEGPSLQLRIFNGAPNAFEKERALLAQVRSALPVHEVLLADGSASLFPRPFMVSRWIDGITLNECRKRVSAEVFLTLAEPLGALATRVAQTKPPPEVPREYGSTQAMLEIADAQLRAGLARERLGAVTADGLRRVLDEHAHLLAPAGDNAELVHGDFGGRNIVVAAVDGGWRIAGLIDWEMAFCGWGLWDVGSLFRYAGRYSAAFRVGFARGYCEAGGVLPDDWYRVCRLLDATRSIATLAEERELPDAFADCRQVLAGVLADW